MVQVRHLTDPGHLPTIGMVLGVADWAFDDAAWVAGYHILEAEGAAVFFFADKADG